MEIHRVDGVGHARDMQRHEIVQIKTNRIAKKIKKKQQINKLYDVSNLDSKKCTLTQPQRSFQY